MMEIDKIRGVKVPAFQAPHFKEFVINFDGTGKTVADINQTLMARGIFGGVDLSKELPDLGESALYCVTEVHTKEDINRLANALAEAVG
jgi:glycine dehydrogenase subunit 1